MNAPGGMRRRAPAADLPVVHRLPIRVYWEDTDAGGIVYHANHLRWFERARSEWLRAAGVAQQALREREGVVFVVIDAQLRWLAPARLDDELVATVAVAAAGSVSMTFAQRLLRPRVAGGADRPDGDAGGGEVRGDDVLAEAVVRVGCLDAATMRPRRLPRAVAAALGVGDASGDGTANAPPAAAGQASSPTVAASAVEAASGATTPASFQPLESPSPR